MIGLVLSSWFGPKHDSFSLLDADLTLPSQGQLVRNPIPAYQLLCSHSPPALTSPQVSARSAKLTCTAQSRRRSSRRKVQSGQLQMNGGNIHCKREHLKANAAQIFAWRQPRIQTQQTIVPAEFVNGCEWDALRHELCEAGSQSTWPLPRCILLLTYIEPVFCKFVSPGRFSKSKPRSSQGDQRVVLLEITDSGHALSVVRGDWSES